MFCRLSVRTEREINSNSRGNLDFIYQLTPLTAYKFFTRSRNSRFRRDRVLRYRTIENFLIPEEKFTFQIFFQIWTAISRKNRKTSIKWWKLFVPATMKCARCENFVGNPTLHILYTRNRILRTGYVLIITRDYWKYTHTHTHAHYTTHIIGAYKRALCAFRFRHKDASLIHTCVSFREFKRVLITRVR